MNYVYCDGGRSNYYKGKMAGDCVFRAISIALGKDYKEVFEALTCLSFEYGLPQNDNKVWKKYLSDNSWKETKYGMGAVPLNQMSFDGKAIAYQSSHLVAVDTTTIYDTWNCEHRRCWRSWEEAA
jgi:hypothetical protein